MNFFDSDTTATGISSSNNKEGRVSRTGCRPTASISLQSGASPKDAHLSHLAGNSRRAANKSITPRASPTPTCSSKLLRRSPTPPEARGSRNAPAPTPACAAGGTTCFSRLLSISELPWTGYFLGHGALLKQAARWLSGWWACGCCSHTATRPIERTCGRICDREFVEIRRKI